MTSLRRAIGFGLAAALLVACRPADDAEPSQDSGAFFARFTADWIRHDPNLAVSTRWLEGEEQAALELSEDQRVAADIMRSQLQMPVDGEPHLDLEYPLQQMNGANVSLPNQLTVTHPVRTPQDAESYVARLGQVGERMREAVGELDYQAELGIVAPRFIVQATIGQMRSFIRPPPAEDPLATTLADKMHEVAELPAADRSSLAAEAARIVEEQVYLAWREAIAACWSGRSTAGSTKPPSWAA